jgi:predicted ABC-type ATPase
VVQLHYLRLDSPDTALRRVGQRVKEGGHDVPEGILRRRFIRSLRLLEQVYKPAVDSWIVYDNSGMKPRIVMEGSNNG